MIEPLTTETVTSFYGSTITSAKGKTRMKSERPLVDKMSFNLAEHFLSDEQATEDEKWELADVIQQAVEGWFGAREHT